MLTLTDLQAQFEAGQMTRLTRGEPLRLAPAYQEVYENWLQEERVKMNLVKWSAHDRTEEFLLYLEKTCDKKLSAWIEAQALPEDKKALLRHQAKRGELVLFTKDGRNFDEVLQLNKLDPKSAFSYSILSPTLRETLTNRLEWKALSQEQHLLSVARRLEGAGYLVQGLRMDNGKVEADVVRSSSQTPYKVTVDLTRDLAQPLVYDFLDAQGSHTQVNERHLGDDWGQAKSEFQLGPNMTAELLVAQTMEEEKARNAALLTGATAILAPRLLPMEARNETETRGLTVRNAKLIQPNVTASKTALRTRIQQEKQSFKEEQTRFQARKQAAYEEEEKNRLLEQNLDEEASTQNEQSLSPASSIAKAAVAAGTVALTGGVGTALFLTTTLQSTGLT